MQGRKGTPVGEMVTCRVELYGLPRLVSGLREVEVTVPLLAGERELVSALTIACPALVGRVLREDRAGLRDGYAFNLNGQVFLDAAPHPIREGDIVLLLSSVAGG